MTDREFTVEEANELLETLRSRLERIRAARRTLFAAAEVVAKRASGNGDHPGVFEALRTLREEVEAILQTGVVLRDADSGLVDFPSRLGGRPVFLCWRLGEERVAYWHDPSSGFSGRRPLDP